MDPRSTPGVDPRCFLLLPFVEEESTRTEIERRAIIERGASASSLLFHETHNIKLVVRERRLDLLLLCFPMLPGDFCSSMLIAKNSEHGTTGQ
jgi:hypothetical protein